MTQEEIQRFIRTTDALEPRRKVYRHIDDESDYIIALITEAIVSGNNRTIDIFNHIKNSRGRGIEHANLVEILNSKLDHLWVVSNDKGRTKYYHLIEVDCVEN
ncbi:MAG: hypothetical protein ACXW1Z_24350 [Methylobacter sp.]